MGLGQIIWGKKIFAHRSGKTFLAAALNVLIPKTALDNMCAI